MCLKNFKEVDFMFKSKCFDMEGKKVGCVSWDENNLYFSEVDNSIKEVIEKYALNEINPKNLIIWKTSAEFLSIQEAVSDMQRIENIYIMEYNNDKGIVLPESFKCEIPFHIGKCLVSSGNNKSNVDLGTWEAGIKVMRNPIFELIRPIRFSKPNKRWGCFSNFKTCTVEYNGLKYHNSEAAWQSQKSLNKFERENFISMNGSAAKKAGRRVKPLRPDWEKVKFDIMYEVCLAKFSQNPDLKEILLSSGGAELIEDTTGWHDNIWGSCTCTRCKGKGDNALGKILMKVRDTLANN